MLIPLIERTPKQLLGGLVQQSVVVTNEPPVAGFTAVVTGRSVAFTDTSTDDGTIVAWDWDFGDGTAHGTTQNPTHFYSGADGDKTVTLVVTDDKGLSSVAFQDDVTIAALTPVVSLLTAGTLTATQSAFPTASVTTTSKPTFLFFSTVKSPGPPIAPTGVASTGKTWTLVSHTGATGMNPTGTPLRLLTVWMGVGAGGTGVITVTHSDTPGGAIWHVMEVTNSRGDTTPRQAVSQYLASGTTMTNTLAALDNAKNVHLACTMTRSASHAAIDHDADFAELADTDVAGLTNTVETQWALNQTACTPVWAGTDSAVMISLEIEAG